MADRNLDHLYPEFRVKVQAILDGLSAYAAKNMKGYKWIVVEGFRTAKYQHSLWEKGRTKPGPIVTLRDGFTKRSTHQSSMAVDIAPKHGFLIDWNVPKAHWEYLGHLAREQGLDWGGDWRSPDKPHVEWNEDDVPMYRKAREWQKANGLAQRP